VGHEGVVRGPTRATTAGRVRGFAAVTALVGALLAGCSDGDEPTVEPPPTSEAPVTTTGTVTDTATASETPTAAPTTPRTPTAPTSTATPSGEEPAAASPTDTRCVYSGGGWICVGLPTEEPTAGGPVPEGSGCSPQGETLPDGTWFGLITEATPEAIEFDLACWFVGDDAEQAATEDGFGPVNNDYYVRNASEKVRTVPAADATQVAFHPEGIPDQVETATLAEYLTAVEDRGFVFGVWLTVENGAVTQVREQWVP